MKKVIMAGVLSILVAIAINATINTIQLVGILTGHVVYLPTCANEDGNSDGKPCVWTDPDTGNKYVVDSSEYRN